MLEYILLGILSTVILALYIVGAFSHRTVSLVSTVSSIILHIGYIPLFLLLHVDYKIVVLTFAVSLFCYVAVNFSVGKLKPSRAENKGEQSDDV